jgi:VWA domain containing CoxE-like protein
MGLLERRNVVLVTTAFLLTAALASSAQQPQSATNNCVRRSIPLTVMRRSQQPTEEPKSLQVLVNGNKVSGVSSTSYSGPVRILLLVDTSGSMKPLRGTTDWGLALPTAAFAMDAVPLNAAVAVGRFAEQLQLSQWQDRDSARDRVLSLKYQSPKGKTALYSAVNEALSVFRGVQFADTIYLVTDGAENHSAVSSRHLVENLVARGIRVFVFLVVPSEPYKTPEEQNGPQEMEELANLTGGALLKFPWSKDWLSSGEASATVRQIREHVASPYQVDFQLTSPLNKEAKLKVEAPFDPKLYTLAYPRRLEPCTDGSAH